jgi:alkanesulfonate monooxygenase SsuD/methylene tetrahydromethanopterin reductase-like flavin-dependent oxidoreductase (luciferase family)
MNEGDGDVRRVRRGVALTPMETRRDVIVEMAVLADRLGYEIFSTPEGWGFDSTLVLTEIALKTERIRPMSGILSVWSRTPGAIAMNAATLAEISGGRYILGLGASTRALAEGYHNQRFQRPAQKLRETATEVRRLLDGERADLDDGIESRALKMGQAPQPDLPIVIAAMGPKSIRVMAECADGWFPFYVTRDRFDAWTPEVLGMRRAAGRGEAAFDVLSGPTVAVSEDIDEARQSVAANVAWYVTAMGDVYANSLRAEGYGAEVDAVIAANPKPNPKTAVVPPEAEVLLEQLTAFGPPDRVQAALTKWDARVDVAMVGIAPGTPWPQIEAILRASAPSPV